MKRVSRGVKQKHAKLKKAKQKLDNRKSKKFRQTNIPSQLNPPKVDAEAEKIATWLENREIVLQLISLIPTVCRYAFLILHCSWIFAYLRRVKFDGFSESDLKKIAKEIQVDRLTGTELLCYYLAMIDENQPFAKMQYITLKAVIASNNITLSASAVGILDAEGMLEREHSPYPFSQPIFATGKKFAHVNKGGLNFWLYVSEEDGAIDFWFCYPLILARAVYKRQQYLESII